MKSKYIILVGLSRLDKTVSLLFIKQRRGKVKIRVV